MYAERAGSGGPPLTLVHGSLAPGWETWSEQRELANDYSLVVLHRPGYPPNSPLQSSDFNREATEVAAMLEAGTHLVGHSYGAVVALLAAAAAPARLASLTLIEPPAFGVARGHPAVDELVERMTPIVTDRAQSRRTFLLRFLEALGSSEPLPDPLPPGLEARAAAAMAERPPWEATIPFEELRRAELRVLIVSGGHSPAFDAVCDVIEAELGAARATIPGNGHEVQALGEPFNQRLRQFMGDALNANA